MAWGNAAMSLRITGGEARGRSISSPDGRAVRPTSSKIRQALFNILGKRVVDAQFLDLFGGSGLMGIEAISRGAAGLTTIEQDRKLAANISNSLAKLNYEADVIVGDVRERLGDLEGSKFDIIFADPPYKSPLAKSVLQLVDRYGLLSDDGIMIIEHAKETDLPLEKVALKLTNQREYGQTSLSFFQKAAPETQEP
jgi:16S rRNA (guanine(966)-N(2))-methyltransferase RsmD